MSSAAFAPLAIMSVVAPLAVIDILYFHVYRFRLYRRPESRLETVTHLLRTGLFAATAFVLVTYEPRGAWFWVVAGLLVADFVNNVADVLLEPASRASLGGLPPLEYLIHVVGATASGVIAGAWFVGGHTLAAQPTELAPPAELPAWLAANAHVLYAGGLLLLLGEGALLVHAAVRGARPPATTPAEV